MNLQQYIIENPSDDLATVQAHTVTVDTKQVGSGQARGLFITEMGAGAYSAQTIWAIFSAAAADVTSPLFSLASAILITASDSGSYFGMDETKADGIANRTGIATLVAMGVMTQATADKFIAKTLSVTTPFADTTQVEFDAAKAELLISGSAESFVSYGEVDSSQLFHVRSNNTKTQIEISLDTVATHDTKFKVFVSKPSGITGTYVEQPNAISTGELIKAGAIETVLILEQFYGRHTKYRIVSDKIGTSTALVTSVSKY